MEATKVRPILNGIGLCKCKRCGEIISDEERKENKGKCDKCYYTCSECGSVLEPRERTSGKCFNCDDELAGDNEPFIGYDGYDMSPNQYDVPTARGNRGGL